MHRIGPAILLLALERASSFPPSRARLRCHRKRHRIRKPFGHCPGPDSPRCVILRAARSFAPQVAAGGAWRAMFLWPALMFAAKRWRRHAATRRTRRSAAGYPGRRGRYVVGPGTRTPAASAGEQPWAAAAHQPSTAQRAAAPYSRGYGEGSCRQRIGCRASSSRSTGTANRSGRAASATGPRSAPPARIKSSAARAAGGALRRRLL